MREELSGSEKAAIVLLSLSRESAASIMSGMQQHEIVKLASAMSNLGFVKSEVVDFVLEQLFEEMSNTASITNSNKAAENILSSFFSKEQVSSILSNICNDVWRALEMIDPKMFAQYLSKEHPQAAAFILSQIKPSQTASVLSFLEEEFANSMMERMINLKPISPDLVEEIEKCLTMELIVGIQGKDSKRDVVKQLSCMLRSMADMDRDKYLQWLKDQHPQIYQSVEPLMFVFEDLTRLRIGDANILISSLPQEDLVLALKKVSKNVQNFFFKNIPQRMMVVIKDEWTIMGKVKVKDVQDAQRRILGRAKSLINEGKISLSINDAEHV